MSGGKVCICDQPREKRLRVVVYKGNYSAFNGGRFQSSDYSLIRCLQCGKFFRTKAAYVSELDMAANDEASRP